MKLRWYDTGNVLAVIDAAVDGTEGAAGNDAFDDELGGVNLPVLPAPPLLLRRLRLPQPRGPAAAAPWLRRGWRVPLLAAEVALQLLVEALEVDLIRPHEPRVPAPAAACAWKPHAWSTPEESDTRRGYGDRLGGRGRRLVVRMPRRGAVCGLWWLMAML